jgi:hypothetical protein
MSALPLPFMPRKVLPCRSIFLTARKALYFEPVRGMPIPRNARDDNEKCAPQRAPGLGN